MHSYSFLGVVCAETGNGTSDIQLVGLQQQSANRIHVVLLGEYDRVFCPMQDATRDIVSDQAQTVSGAKAMLENFGGLSLWNIKP